MAATNSEFALSFKILKKCSTTKARTSILTLPHAVVRTPVFMPVGTQGTLKGLLPEQLEQLQCNLMLSNTYHLGMRPVRDMFSTSSLEFHTLLMYVAFKDCCQRTESVYCKILFFKSLLVNN